MQNETRDIIGIDFGTTNSSVAFAAPQSQGGQVQMVSFPLAAGGDTFSSRSLLYLERQMHAARKPVSAWTGPQGIEKYLAHDSFSDETQGRLIQSLKSYLSARTLTGTEIFGKQYRFEDLVARILTNLRLRASEALGFEVKRAIAGRPVMFVGADNDDDNAFAENRLRAAFEQAGFTDVTFAMEPVAAAYAYESTVQRDELVLIGDFGGGTTDFSLLRVGPSARNWNTNRGELQVLGNSGVGIAGDAFDARIVRRLISPALGSESVAISAGKKLPVLPAWVYANLERWHTLSFLRTHTTMDMLRMAEKRAAAKKAPEREQIASLITIVEHDLGYRLHQAVQRVKVELSHHDQAEFVLNADMLHLRAAVTRAQFEEWISPELERMSESLDGLLRDTGIAANQVDRVFLTGGTSLVPAVRRIFTSRFGGNRVQSGEAFTSVAYGLALMAAGK
ncbi:Hsp70 family protein [Silvibacterium sp.]|uniref:Hsp70 family protein n=1 Tax=Silvibacterium sp. TaxID=1964179 RepID=UPI0039E59F94